MSNSQSDSNNTTDATRIIYNRFYKDNPSRQAELAAAKTALHQNLAACALAQADAPCCPSCGAIMYRNGSCYLCYECGTTTGCS